MVKSSSLAALGLTALLLAFFWNSPANKISGAYKEIDRPEQQGGRLVDARFGKGFIAEKRGERILIPTRGYLRRERGTIEMWLRLGEKRPEWSAVFTAQEEPYPERKLFTPFQLRGLIIQFTEHFRKLIFTLGPLIHSQNTLVVSGLDWKGGEDHHLAASWGEQGMHLYLDGEEVAANRFTGSITLPRLMAVGSYVWEAAAEPSQVVIDDLRISDTQRAAPEVMNTYRSAKPARADDHNLLLMSFDQPPVLRPGGTAAETTAPSVPAAPAASSEEIKVLGGRLTQGRYGKGYITERPGDMVMVPAAGRIQTERGTIEMWVRPALPASQRPEWGALFSMLQQDPSPSNLRGLILTYVDHGKRIAFIRGKMGDPKATLGSPALDWPVNEDHHVAAAWGEAGMALYLDGKKVAQNRSHESLPPMSPYIAVGSHDWDIIRRPSFTVIDDVKVSDEPRTEEQIRQDAASSSPAKRDAHTLLLVSFNDGQVRMPVRLVSGRPLNIFRPGEEIVLTIPAEALPSSQSKSRELPVSMRADGGEMRQIAGAWTSQGLRLHLGTAAQPGYHALEVSVATQPAASSYYWVAAALPRQDARTSIFGIGQHEARSMDEKFFAAAQDLGVKWLRLSFDWSVIEPQRSRNDWEQYDRITNLARSHDVQLLGTLFWEEPLPAWQGKSTSGTNKYSVGNLAAWTEHVRRVVERYKDRVHAWDPWNEPNLNTYWYPKPEPAAYVALLKATHDAIKSADPNAVIVGCGLAEIDLKFYEESFRLGALRYSDAVAVHPYIFPASPDAPSDVTNLGGALKLGPPLSLTWLEGLRRLEALIRQYGGSQKIWLTELGQHTAPVPGVLPPGLEVSEEKQAEYLAKFFVEAMSSGSVEHLFWFSFWGSAAGPFAILREDGSPKPAAMALRTLAAHLANAAPVRSERLSNQAKLYWFEVMGKTVGVIWSTGGPLKVLAKGPGLQAYTLLGRLEPGERVSGGLAYSVTGQPLIMEAVTSVRSY